jgi:hypothetical protein
VKIRHLFVIGLLAFGLPLMPLAAGVADAKSGCTPRGKHKHYPPGQCKLGTSSSNPKPGETITVDGEGYQSNSSVDVTLNSAPVHLVTAHTDANGDFVNDVTIPCDTAPGDHTISASGQNTDNDSLTLFAGIKVQNTACVLAAQTTAPPAQTPAAEQARGTLPFTGSAATALLLTLAIGMLVAGSVAVRVARRRGHSPSNPA